MTNFKKINQICYMLTSIIALVMALYLAIHAKSWGPVHQLNAELSYLLFTGLAALMLLSGMVLGVIALTIPTTLP